MNLVWSVPVRGESLSSTRGDMVRARSLIAALRAGGHRVTVVEDHQAPAARIRVGAYRRFVRPALPEPIATAARDLVRVAHGRAHGRRVAAVALREGADLIVETQVHFADSGAVASRLSGVPLLLDDCSPWTEEGVLGAALPGLARRVFRTQTRAAAGLAASSCQIRDRLVKEGAPPDRVHVVPNGVDTEVYRTVDRAAARERMGFGDEVVVAFVGSFQPWHRVELLLEAFHRTGDVGLHLHLIGDGPGREAVLARAEALGLGRRVTAPGALYGPDLAVALVASDIGALPASNDYGQPMKLLDYAAAGLAIVAAELPPVRDMIEPEVTGLLVRPEDPQALTAALVTLVRAPNARARLGRSAHDRLAAGATWQACTRTLLGGAALALRSTLDHDASGRHDKIGSSHPSASSWGRSRPPTTGRERQPRPWRS